jgi:hypothetical protein
MQQAILGSHDQCRGPQRRGRALGHDYDDRERQALIAACENVPGVRAVHDHLVWIEPNSGFVIQSEEDEARTPATS